MNAIDPKNVTMEACAQAMKQPLTVEDVEALEERKARAMSNAAVLKPDPERAAFDEWFSKIKEEPLGNRDVRWYAFQAFMAGTAHGLQTALERIKRDL